ncbi:reverse transcriptase domain-containing protein [Tanacetum coccineum]
MDNENRVNHANHFVPRSVQLNAGRPNINSVRPNINTGRTNVNSVRPRVNTGNSNVNTVRSRTPSIYPGPETALVLKDSRPIDRNTAKMSNFNAVKGNWGNVVKTSTFPQGDQSLEKGLGHMDWLTRIMEVFEECKGGSVTFGGSKGYITGKGRIRVERTVGENRASWSDRLDDALWAFRTAYKTPIGCTPYKLVYGKSCHLPIELEHRAYWALKHANFDLKTAGDHRKLQLNELNELRDQAYENSLIYKERTKKLHDSKIKNRIFNVSDQVLLFNSRLKIFSGKLKTRWSVPFTITEVFPYGTAKLSHSYYAY